MNKHTFISIKDLSNKGKGISPYKFVECKYCGVMYTQHELNLSTNGKFK